MIIHLAGSAQNISKDLPYLRKIVDIISQNEGSVAYDWITEVTQQADKKDNDIDWQKAMNGSITAIGRSDIVIIEATNYSFTQGYEAATAIQQKKPTLVLTRKKLKDLSVSGLKGKLLSKAEYKTEEDLVRVVTDFIKANTIATKDLRFNMFIDRPIYNYLRSVSYDSGKNKSEIIRELIEREIRKQQD